MTNALAEGQWLVAKNGMMVMAGMSLKATLFLVGNPTVGKQIFEQDHAAGLSGSRATPMSR